MSDINVKPGDIVFSFKFSTYGADRYVTFAKVLKKTAQKYKVQKIESQRVKDSKLNIFTGTADVFEVIPFDRNYDKPLLINHDGSYTKKSTRTHYRFQLWTEDLHLTEELDIHF